MVEKAGKVSKNSRKMVKKPENCPKIVGKLSKKRRDIVQK